MEVSWKYTPSNWSQRIPVAILGGVAFFIAIYLGLYQWGLIKTVWDPWFGQGTKQVLTSEVSHQITEWVQLPDAILGAVAYLGDILYSLAGSTQRWKDRPWLVFLFGLCVIPLGIVSTLLVILQGTVVGSWCFLCLVSAFLSFLLIFFAYGEVKACFLYLYEIYKLSSCKKLVWSTFLGNPSEMAEQVSLQLLRKWNVG